MDQFSELLKIADRLLGENGCPWDRKQTLHSLQPYLLEETHELIEAIDSQSPEMISEELGDVLYALVFIAKLCEGKNLFTIDESIDSVSKKLIRRHPHIFGDLTVSSSEDVVENWEAIKAQEMAGKGRKTVIDGIPATLPTLPRVQKILCKLKRAKSSLFPEEAKGALSEEEVGERLWNLIAEAELSGIDAESALRRVSGSKERAFKEKNTGE